MENGNVKPLQVRATGEMGLIVAWSPNGEADLQKMADAFAKIGYGEFAPSPRELKEALRAALVAEYSKKNQRVAPVANKGYEVTREVEIEGEIRNRHEHVLSAWVKKDQHGDPTLFIDDPAMVSTVIDWVEAAKKRVDSTAIGEALTKTVTALRGVKIRDAGGAYWLPPSSVGRWLQLKEALDEAGRPVRLREFEQAATARTVASVIDSVESLVDSTLEQMMVAIESGELGERALAKKQQETSDLAAQLAEYESVLGMKLDEVRKRIDEVHIRAMQAEALVMHQKDERERLKAQASGYQPGA
jgi:hypothetical protein